MQSRLAARLTIVEFVSPRPGSAVHMVYRCWPEAGQWRRRYSKRVCCCRLPLLALYPICSKLQ
ncbi:hypothetical protein T440DRAFT_471321 [Plenodomus tracheiphilus IPT5]|uniref:Uncharacterized protein n=1 Tax=Plenodomus tracheiphilus IPT5 TaxID=1408161 RepID=A0A6A7AUL8_9PLEO|nr:hypothetical protein T440DRAFT_471321 [Plenodomus tracheiphilus IPT5]